MGLKKKPVFQFLDTNGNGTGTKNAIGNYASPTNFYITPGGAIQMVIHRVIIHVEDDAQFNAGGYGGLSTLTNGIYVKYVWRDGTTFDLTGGLPIKNNSDYARICYDTSYDSFPAGNNYLHARWTFAKSGNPLYLSSGDELRFVLNDNFSTLVGHYFMVQGYIL